MKNKKIFLTLIVVLIILIGVSGYFVYNKKIINSNPISGKKEHTDEKIYSVDELVESSFKEGLDVLVAGRFNMEDINAGSDYEGPGGGDYLFGDEKNIYLEWKKTPNKIKFNDKIKVKGKVGYCGGGKTGKYICKLTKPKLIKIINDDNLGNNFCISDSDCAYYLGPDACGCLRKESNFSYPNDADRMYRSCEQKPQDEECYCVNNKCVLDTTKNQANNCVGEGQIFSTLSPSNTVSNLKCCDGLNEIGFFKFSTLKDDIMVCAKCPNGECGLGESKLNCPEDCKGEDIAGDDDFKRKITQCYNKDNEGEDPTLDCERLNDSLIKESGEKLIIDQLVTNASPNKDKESKYSATCDFEYINMERNYKKIKLKDCELTGELTSVNMKNHLIKIVNNGNFWRINNSYFERCICYNLLMN